ncbi:ApaG domain-containing protein [Deinococcus ruber]|uniref:Protein ApaG n=1 Tax=Deinococcus ruber TaxID=1848197 RepID=A0A918FEW1_9DEIO|nr:ApaG domain [Deinococcus ruber]GGR32343.1 protein ApaG [Deinococcus ruber]
MDALPDLRVTVEPRFRPDYSEPGRWLFQYIIRIENHTSESWQVVAREWMITDGLGRVTSVSGEGVVGQMPILPPGGVYVYDSFVTLESTPGRMSGLLMLRDAWNAPGRTYIPEFELRLPLEFSEMEEKGETPGRVLN